MSFLAAVVGVAVAVVVGVTVALLVSRRAGRSARAELDGLRHELEQQRDASLAQTIETVLSLARDQLQTHTAAGDRALEQRNAAVGEQLGRLNGELSRVTELVHRLETDRERRLGELGEAIAQTGQQTSQLASVTHTLREALTSSQTRGQWGERMADDVLRMAGFVEGVNYRRQQTIGGGRPDFTFLLPGDRVLHMDVKFPLGNYLRHLEADTDSDRDRYRTAFLRDVRQRISELEGRGYIDPSNGTLDYVLLFLPNEHVYAFVHQHDRELLDLALGSKVILCSPTTLLAVLAVVRQAIDNFALETTSREILDVLASFEQEWGRFVDQMDKLDRRLDGARKDFDQLVGTRRRQLERKLDEIGELRTSRGGEEGPPGRLRAVEGEAASA